MARSKAYLFGGVEIRWSCAKELVEGTGRAGEGDVPFRRRAQGLSLRGHQQRDAWFIPTSSPARGQGRRHGGGAMGGRLDRRQRRLPLLLLQHHPHPGRRHPRVRPARGAVADGHQGSCRARGSGQARGVDHQRRRDDRRRLHGFGVHPRAGIPGPDQGPARDRGSDPHRRERDPRSVRPLARRQSHAGQQAARLGDRPGGRAHPPPAGKGSLAQDRGAQAAPSRQARRLHQHRRPGLGDLHRRGRLGRRLGQAGARPRLAGGPAVARKDPQRRQRRQGQAGAATSSSPTSGPGARLRHRRALPRRGPALRAASS